MPTKEKEKAEVSPQLDVIRHLLSLRQAIEDEVAEQPDRIKAALNIVLGGINTLSNNLDTERRLVRPDDAV